MLMKYNIGTDTEYHTGESKMDVNVHDVTDITIGPIEYRNDVFWRKIKIKTRRGTHEVTCFEAAFARADKGENLEITLSESPI